MIAGLQILIRSLITTMSESLAAVRAWRTRRGGVLKIAFWLIGSTPEGGEGDVSLSMPPAPEPTRPKDSLPSWKQRRGELKEFLMRPLRISYESLDAHGFADIAAPAWFTKVGRARRAASTHTQGP